MLKPGWLSLDLRLKRPDDVNHVAKSPLHHCGHDISSGASLSNVACVSLRFFLCFIFWRLILQLKVSFDVGSISLDSSCHFFLFFFFFFLASEKTFDSESSSVRLHIRVMGISLVFTPLMKSRLLFSLQIWSNRCEKFLFERGNRNLFFSKAPEPSYKWLQKHSSWQGVKYILYCTGILLGCVLIFGDRKHRMFSGALFKA